MFGLLTQMSLHSSSTLWLEDPNPDSAAETRLKLLTGKGTKYRQIDVIERVQATRHRNAKASLESTTSVELTGVENLWASQRSPGLMHRPILNSTTKILPLTDLVSLAKD